MLQSWRTALGVVRLLAAAGCLAMQLFSARFATTEAAILFTAYAIYAGAALVWRSFEESRVPQIALVIDYLFFLLAAFQHADYNGLLRSVFFVYVIVSAAILHSWWEALAVTVTAIPLIAALSPSHAGGLLAGVIGAGLTGMIFAFYANRLQDRLSAASRASALYRYDAERARESERERIAADFHDGPLQSFISFQMRLELIRKLLLRDSASGMEELTQLQEICRSQVNDLRTFVRGMRPVDVDGSLNATLRRLVQQFEKDSGITATFVSNEFFEPAEPAISLELLQIVREALHNVQKHASATRVSVSVQKIDGGLEISIEDNGQGFPFCGRFSIDELENLRLGPVSIRRRARSLGADLTLNSRPGEGVGLLIRLAA